jgi:hypothetical protein
MSVLPSLRLSAGALALGCGVWLAGCQEPTVGVRVVFPSELAFLHTAVARVDVYDGSDAGARSPDAICRALSQNPPTPPAGVQVLATSGNTDACLLPAGGVTLDGVGVGRRVIFVEGIDVDGRPILRGCTVVDLFGDDATLTDDDAAVARDLGANALVEVQLSFLPDFPAGDAGCSSITEKCEEAVSCRP